MGSAVAKALAREGATVFVTGHRRDPVETFAAELVAAGGTAEAIEVDALDGKAVNQCLDEVVRRARTLDISFNAIGLKDKQNVR